MILYYIRHGDPCYNPDSLTELGLKQAEALSKRLINSCIDEIYSSSSIRAIQTAMPTAKLYNKEIIQLEWAHESIAWEFFAKPVNEKSKTWIFRIPKYVEMFAKDEVYALRNNWYEYNGLDDESFKKGVKFYQEKVYDFLETLGYKYNCEKHGYDQVFENNKKIALFAHQGFFIAFLSTVLDIPYPLISLHFDMQHSGMTIIDFQNLNGTIYPKVLQLSNDSHLYKENMATTYNYKFKV